MRDVLRFAIVLFVVNLVAASTLAGVYNLTEPRIIEQKKLVKQQALRLVMPESVGNRIEPVMEGKKVKYWKVYRNNKSSPNGFIFVARKYGYSSVIETIVGMKKDGTITGVRVLSQGETPGLGARIVEVASNMTLWKALRNIFSGKKLIQPELNPYFTEQFNGLNIVRLELSEDSVHAITGATITSRAVVESIRAKGLEVLNAR